MTENDAKSEKLAQPLCRTCGESVVSDAPTFPFCSDRCKMVDLGKWFDGKYSISRDIKDGDFGTVE